MTFDNFIENEVKSLWLVLLYLFSFRGRRPLRSENCFFSLRFRCFTSFRFHFCPLVDPLTQARCRSSPPRRRQLPPHVIPHNIQTTRATVFPTVCRRFCPPASAD